MNRTIGNRVKLAGFGVMFPLFIPKIGIQPLKPLSKAAQFFGREPHHGRLDFFNSTHLVYFTHHNTARQVCRVRLLFQPLDNLAGSFFDRFAGHVDAMPAIFAAEFIHKVDLRAYLIQRHVGLHGNRIFLGTNAA